MRIAKKSSLFLLLAVFAVLSGQARRRAVQPSAPPPPTPIASADTYTVERGKTLTVTAASGVLANDSDPQSKPLSATLVSSTTHGVVILNPDGGFSYANDASAATSDSFTYRASNGTASSQVATVTIVITDPPPATPDFFVTSPGFFYQFSGVSGQNPVITLQRGRTYRFSIDADDIHPFQILGAPAGSVQNNNISFGIITFTVPTTAANYQYHCSLHNFGNAINTTP